MSYPLPQELATRITKLIREAGVKNKRTTATLFDAIAVLLVRENRLLRQEVAELRRSLLDQVEQEEEDYGDAISAYAGEETCNHILEKILKPHVYYNSEEAKRRQEAVERAIQEFNKQG